MAKAGDVLPGAPRTADRQGNGFEGVVGVEQVCAALMVLNSGLWAGHLTSSPRDVAEGER